MSIDPVARLQAAWDACPDLPPIEFTPEEAKALVDALEPPPMIAEAGERERIAKAINRANWTSNAAAEERWQDEDIRALMFSQADAAIAALSTPATLDKTVTEDIECTPPLSPEDHARIIAAHERMSTDKAEDLAIADFLRFVGYDRSNPLSIRFDFASEANRIAAADEVDLMLSDAFASARARMAAVLAEAREARGGRKIKVRAATLDNTAVEGRYRQALEDVCDPLGYLRRRAEAEGSRLGGMAYAIANDIGTLQRIARDALSTAQTEKADTPTQVNEGDC